MIVAVIQQKGFKKWVGYVNRKRVYEGKTKNQLINKLVEKYSQQDLIINSSDDFVFGLIYEESV
jgi:hypothetical protein